MISQTEQTIIIVQDEFLSRIALYEEDVHNITEIFFKCNAKKLADIDSKVLIANETFFVDIFQTIEDKPLIGRQFLKYFSKHHYPFRSNTFYLICHLILGSIPRFQVEATHSFAGTLTTIWNAFQPLENEGWLKQIVRVLPSKGIRQRIHYVLSALVVRKSQSKLFKCLAVGLQKVSLELIAADASKTPAFRVVEGRLQDSGQIGFFGRRLFVELAVVNVDGLGEQLNAIIDALFATSANVSIAYVLIDVLLELTLRVSAVLLNNSDIFLKLISGVCALPNEVAVVMIRSIIPVINKRGNLRVHLLNTMKVYLLNSEKVSAALPIILLLLKSLSEQSSIRKASQISQSFATFSSQTLVNFKFDRQSEQNVTLEVLGCIKRCINQSAYTKCLIYQGLTDICQRNSCFVIQVIDLLVNQAQAVPKMTPKHFVEAAKKGHTFCTIKVPFAHLMKALSSLIRISVNCGEHRDTLTLAPGAGTSLTFRALTVFEELVERALTASNTSGEFPDLGKAANRSQTNVIFAQTLVDAYEIFVEHFWSLNKNKNGVDEKTAHKIVEIMQKRKSIVAMLKSKSTTTADSNTTLNDTTSFEAAPVKKTRGRQKETVEGVAKNLEHVKANPIAVGVTALTLGLTELDRMFGSLISLNYEETLPVYKHLRDELLGWTIEKIYLQTQHLDPYSISSTLPMNVYGSLTKNLITFYLSGKISDSLLIAQSDILKTNALISFSRILDYLIVRYQDRCVTLLTELYEILSATDENSACQSTQKKQTQDHSMISQLSNATLNEFRQPKVLEKDRKEFYRVLVKHLNVYGSNLLPKLFEARGTFADKKIILDFYRQVSALVLLCKRMFNAINVSCGELKKAAFKSLNGLVKTVIIKDKPLLKELWTLVLGCIQRSEMTLYFDDAFTKIITDLRNVGEPENYKCVYASINSKNCEQIIDILIHSLTHLLQNISQAFCIKKEMDERITNEFLQNAIQLTKSVAEHIEQLLESWVLAIPTLVPTMIILGTRFYQTVFDITRRILVEVHAKMILDIDEWSSVNEFGVFVQGSLKALIETSARTLLVSGTELEALGDKDATQNTIKLIRSANREEKIFIQYERTFETLHIELINLSKLLKDDAFDLQIATIISMRDFNIDEKQLKARIHPKNRSKIESTFPVSVVETRRPENLQDTRIEDDDDDAELTEEQMMDCIRSDSTLDVDIGLDEEQMMACLASDPALERIDADVIEEVDSESAIQIAEKEKPYDSLDDSLDGYPNENLVPSVPDAFEPQKNVQSLKSISSSANSLENGGNKRTLGMRVSGLSRRSSASGSSTKRTKREL